MVPVPSRPLSIKRHPVRNLKVLETCSYDVLKLKKMRQNIDM